MAYEQQRLTINFFKWKLDTIRNLNPDFKTMPAAKLKAIIEKDVERFSQIDVPYPTLEELTSTKYSGQARCNRSKPTPDN